VRHLLELIRQKPNQASVLDYRQVVQGFWYFCMFGGCRIQRWDSFSIVNPGLEMDRLSLVFAGNNSFRRGRWNQHALCWTRYYRFWSNLGQHQGCAIDRTKTKFVRKFFFARGTKFHRLPKKTEMAVVALQDSSLALFQYTNQVPVGNAALI
jgi:hypothetical protein